MSTRETDRQARFGGGAVSVLIAAAAGVGVRTALAWATARDVSPAVTAAAEFGSLIAALVMLGALWRVARSEEWVWYPATAVFLLGLYVHGPYHAAMAPFVPELAVLFLAPAGFLIWQFVRTLRHADELQRRVLYESFAAAFVVELVAFMAGSVATDQGVSRPHPIVWAGLLVASWSVALIFSQRRYAR